MKLSQAIRELRHSQRLTLSELARRAGLSPGHLSSVENERFFSPSIQTLIRISNGLNVEMQRLLTLTSLQVTMEDPFVRQVKPYLGALNHDQRKRVLKTLAAAPKQTKCR